MNRRRVLTRARSPTLVRRGSIQEARRFLGEAEIDGGAGDRR
jgi:hypothetical protein